MSDPAIRILMWENQAKPRNGQQWSRLFCPTPFIWMALRLNWHQDVPCTAVWKAAIKDGLISPKDDLLLPKFLVVRRLNDWLSKTVQHGKRSGRTALDLNDPTSNGPCLCDS